MLTETKQECESQEREEKTKRNLSCKWWMPLKRGLQQIKEKVQRHNEN